MSNTNSKFPAGIAAREVIVITIILAVMGMLLMMWLGRTTGDSRRILCERRQQQTAAAMMQFESLQGHFPGYKNLPAIDADGVRQPTGWVFGLLPYFSDGQTTQSRIVEVQCPDDPRMQPDATKPGGDIAMSWVVNTGMPDADKFGELPADWMANGMFENQFDERAALPPRMNSQWLLDHDGLASTLMLSENTDAGAWTDYDESRVGFVWVAELVNGQPVPGDQLLRINRRRGEGDGDMRFARPASYHLGGVNAAFAGGQTQFLSEDIDWLVFTQLLTSDGANAKLPGTEMPVPVVYR